MFSKAVLNQSLSLTVSIVLLLNAGSAKVIFKADFETGDLSQWSTTGTRSQNATPRNVQVVTDIVQQGKYAAKFTIHEDDVFNAQQLRVQVGGPEGHCRRRFRHLYVLLSVHGGSAQGS